VEITGELERLVAEARAHQLLDLLEGLDDAGLASARAWYRETGWLLARGPDEFNWKFISSRRRRSCALALALVLATTPRDAVRRCDWARFGVEARRRDMPTLVAFAARRGAEWCGDFIARSSSVRLTIWEAGVEEIGCLALPLLARFELPVPAGEQYPRGWVALAPESFTHGLGGGRDKPSGYVAMAPRDDGTFDYVAEAGVHLLPFFRATPRVQDTLLAVLRTRNLLGLLRLRPEPEPEEDDDGEAFDEGVRPPERELKDTLDALVLDGTLDPEVLFLETVDALCRNSTQAALTNALALLEALGLDPERIRRHATALVGALPLMPGRATAALLPSLLAAGLSDGDLGDLGATILTRPEKAQKSVLLKFLARRPSGCVAVDDLLALAARSEDTALATRARSIAARRGGSSSVLQAAAAPPLATLPWTLPQDPFRPTPFVPLEPTAQGLGDWLQAATASPSIVDLARLLDVLVRFGRRDVEELRAAVRQLPSTFHHSDVPGYLALKRWGKKGDARPPKRDWYDRPGGWRSFDDRVLQEVLEGLGTPRSLLSTPSREDGVLEWRDLVSRISSVTADERIGEWDLVQALLRLEIPESPSWDDVPAAAGAVTVGGRTLVDVLRRWISCGGLPIRLASRQVYRYLPEEDVVEYEPLDPVLGGEPRVPVWPDDVPSPEARPGREVFAVLSNLTGSNLTGSNLTGSNLNRDDAGHEWTLTSEAFELPGGPRVAERLPASPVPSRRPKGKKPEPDGTIVVREGYGSPRDEPGLRVPSCDLSAVLEALDWASPPVRKALKRLGAPVGRGRHSVDGSPQVQGPMLGVTPSWVEVAAAGARLDRDGAKTFRLWLRSAGPLGLAVHHQLGALLVHQDAGARSEAAATTAELHRQERLDPGLLTEELLTHLALRQLPLTRLASTLEPLAVVAGAAVVWRVLSPVLQEACAMMPKPAGLADLLRASQPVVAAAAAHEPEVTLPPTVLALAASKGSSKAAVEARALGRLL
jgi:hypothetical protein